MRFLLSGIAPHWSKKRPSNRFVLFHEFHVAYAPIASVLLHDGAIGAYATTLMGKFDSGKGRRRDTEFKPIEVWVESDNVERAIRILKRKMADEGVFRELKKRRYYEKPSEARKRKRREAERRRRKALRKARS